jgi:hypothetical protein
LSFWKVLMAATMRSLTSPLMAPLYCPAQARSYCIASRSACAMALAVSAGVCKAGRIGIVVTGLGLPAATGGVICACAEEAATIINVAVSIDLMTCPNLAGLEFRWMSIDVAAMKHICWVGDSRAMVQGS